VFTSYIAKWSKTAKSFSGSKLFISFFNSICESMQKKARYRISSKRYASAKAQSAMEYLMTYGWAILIISVVLGALFQLGVFNANNFAPKAPPGSCQVFRPYGPGTTSFINLEGICNGELPQYAVSTYSGYMKFPISNPQVANGYTLTFWFLNTTTSSSCSSISVMDFSNGWKVGSYIPQCYGPGPGTLTVYITDPITNVGQNWLPPFVKWQNVAIDINFTSNNVGVYRNGNLVFNIIPSNTMRPTSIYSLSISGTVLYANLQLYNTSLSPSQIQALYLEGIGGAPIDLQHLVGWWPLNGDANDYSGNGNNGVPNGVTFVSNWWQGYTPP
jgi:hypothetical protein